MDKELIAFSKYNCSTKNTQMTLTSKNQSSFLDECPGGGYRRTTSSGEKQLLVHRLFMFLMLNGESSTFDVKRVKVGKNTTVIYGSMGSCPWILLG